MFLQGEIYSQYSFDLLGGITNIRNSHFKLNGLESNVQNYSGVKDWEFSVMYGGELSSGFRGNVYNVSFSKRFGEHYFYFRYTPGYQKDFIMTRKFLSDSIPTFLKTNYHYEENFGFGYSFAFMKNLSAGFSLRYFNQEFSRDQVETFFEPVISIRTNTIKNDYNFLLGDIGINYLVENNFGLSISTINLFKSNTNALSEDEPYLLRTDMAGRIGFDYQVSNTLNTKFIYETNSSFLLGSNFGFDLLGGSLNLSLAAFHDKYQENFIAGVIPCINYAGKYFSISISGVKYLLSRPAKVSETEFAETGIHSIVNNKYSGDRAVVSFNFALNTIRERKVQFLDVTIEKDIFPSLRDNYIDYPFAKGKVINLTDEVLVVKPSSMISNLNKENIFSPEISIAPKDTAVIPFYTLINDETEIKKSLISQAIFYINTDGNDPDDEISKPVLINDVNSWDGNVGNLRFFVRKDFDKTLTYAKKIVSRYKQVIDTLPSIMENFLLAKMLFNDFAKKIVYVSDPRASVDRVQFPLETLDLKGGDCDDLSVAFSALLESIGIQTAFVDYKSDSGINHVNLLVNTHLSPGQAFLITVNDRKYILRKNDQGKDEVWIPIETTLLKDFDSAWNAASEKFYDEAIDNFGLAKGSVQIIDVY